MTIDTTTTATTTTTTTATNNNNNNHLKVTGPESIRTLRGNLFQKQVSLIICGESHHEILDLTRENSVVLEQRTWIHHNPKDAVLGDTETPFEITDDTKKEGMVPIVRTKRTNVRKRKNFRGSYVEALKWAENALVDEGDDEEDGVFLVWEEGGMVDGSANGCRCATLCVPLDDDDDGGGGDSSSGTGADDDNTTEYVTFSINSDTTKLFLWMDSDTEARKINHRRVNLNEEISVTELDKLIDKRKDDRKADSGFECWDDWMLRALSSPTTTNNNQKDGAVDVTVVMEAAVPPSEVELHYTRGEQSYRYPLGHRSVQQTECDSDEDSEDEDDPDDGTGAALDYFRRRLVQNGCDVRRIDPRGLGDWEEAEEEEEQKLTKEREALGGGILPTDAEKEYLAVNKLDYPPNSQDDDEDCDNTDDGSNKKIEALPSWEGYFGAASELLYYSPHVKADYTPFLSQLLKTPDTTDRFFRALYFGTVDEAISVLKLVSDEEDQRNRLTCVRSLLYHNGTDNTLYKRPGDYNHLVPVRYAPVGCYLKARGSDPPRTWISALQSNLLRCAGGAPDAKFLLEEVRKLYERSVRYLLQDPKQSDTNGDYFAAYLRAVRRDIYNDIDRSDPEVLRRKETVPSLSYFSSSGGKGKSKQKKVKKHVLRDIEIPDVSAVFNEWKANYDPEAKQPRSMITAARDRVLSQIIVDVYQLRMVDVAAIVSVADRVAVTKSPKVVVVVYAGGDHTNTVYDFFKETMGFSSVGLSSVGKENWKDEESRALTYPNYLHDFDLLFPVPVSAATAAASKKKKKKKKKERKKG